MTHYLYSEGYDILNVYLGRAKYNVIIQGNCLYSNTNDSIDWLALKIKLPEGKWEILRDFSNGAVKSLYKVK